MSVIDASEVVSELSSFGIRAFTTTRHVGSFGTSQIGVVMTTSVASRRSAAGAAHPA